MNMYLLKHDILSIATELHRAESKVFEDPNEAAKVISQAVRQLLEIGYDRIKEE